MAGPAAAFKGVERYAKLIQNLSIIVGVLTATLSLLASQYDKRVTRTVEFRKEYNEGIRSDYLALTGNWQQYTKDIPDFFQLDNETLRRKVIEFFSKPDNDKALTGYLDFFDVLDTCIEHHTCDRNAAIDLFGPSAKFMYEISAYYIADTRTNDRDPLFGRGLEKFYREKPEAFVWRYLYL